MLQIEPGDSRFGLQDHEPRQFQRQRETVRLGIKNGGFEPSRSQTTKGRIRVPTAEAHEEKNQPRSLVQNPNRNPSRSPSTKPSSSGSLTHRKRSGSRGAGELYRGTRAVESVHAKGPGRLVLATMPHGAGSRVSRRRIAARFSPPPGGGGTDIQARDTPTARAGVGIVAPRGVAAEGSAERRPGQR